MSSLVQSPRFRWVTFSVIVIALAALTGVFVIKAIGDQKKKAIATTATVSDQALDLGIVLDAPHIIFRSTAIGPTYGKLGAVPLSDPGGMRATSDRSCDRVYANAEGGMCLSADRGVVTTYSAELLNREMGDRRPITTNGIPSRARMSADDSWAATTSFVSGHGYTDINFSTETTIISPVTGKGLGNLEKQFAVSIDGERITARDLNIWGVTFVPGPQPKEFYATVATGGKTWLARGDMTKRTLTAVQENAECPSISPDGNRIVYKKRVNSRIDWRFTMLDLRTGVETPLSEARSVDDQVEWLDNDHVLYGVQREGSAATDVWVDDVNGGAVKPKILIPYAWSPAVVRSVPAS